MAEEPGRFIAVFARAHFAQHPVDGGVYPVPLAFCPHIGKGDKILLFCLKDYPGHRWEAPGVGLVTRTANRNHNGVMLTDVLYDYQALRTPIARQAILDCLTAAEARQIQYPRFKTHWLRRISLASARCIRF